MKDKYFCLLYTVVLIFPPLHELLHVLTCYAFNVKLYSLKFAMVTHATTNNSLFLFINKYIIDFLTIVIFGICYIIFVFIYLKQLRNKKGIWKNYNNNTHTLKLEVLNNEI